MKIAIDIDNTLIFYKNLLARFLVKLQKIISNCKGKNNRLYEFEWIYRLDDSETNTDIKFGAEEAIKNFIKKGNIIILLSSRPGGNFVLKQTLKQLYEINIDFDKIVLNCNNKAAYCVNNGIDVLIDDNEKNCLRLQAYKDKKIVVHFCDKQMSSKNLIKSADWKQIYKYVQKGEDFIRE